MAIKTLKEYLAKNSKWANEIQQLHELLSDTILEQEIKWGVPTYTLNSKNVVGIAAFKNHCALWFFNGSLLKKNTRLLVNAQEGKTRALRQIRFEKGAVIDNSELLPYVKEAIKNQEEGKEIKALTKKLEIPAELADAFKKDAELKTGFFKLTPGRQREYANYIAEAKRETTKHSRLEKIIPMIKNGVGLHDKYKNC